jgi:hypothetical protein
LGDGEGPCGEGDGLPELEGVGEQSLERPLVGCGDALDAGAFGACETVGPEAGERAGAIGSGCDLGGLADCCLKVGDVGPLANGLGLAAQVGGAVGAKFGDGLAPLGQFGAGFEPVELVGGGLVDIAPSWGTSRADASASARSRLARRPNRMRRPLSWPRAVGSRVTAAVAPARP